MNDGSGLAVPRLRRLLIQFSSAGSMDLVGKGARVDFEPTASMAIPPAHPLWSHAEVIGNASDIGAIFA